MANVTLAANQEVCDLLDYEYVEHQLGELKVNILFSCVNTDDWSDESWINAEGIPSHIIKLPYNKVRIMSKEQVRALMLEKALERLHRTA